MNPCTGNRSTASLFMSLNSSAQRQSITTEQGLEAAALVARQAEALGIRCALMGGIALHLYGFTRATTDVDMVATAELPLPAERDFNFGGKAYLVNIGGREIEIDWVVRTDELDEVYQGALRDAVETPEKLPVISPEWMVIIKYLAARGKDQIDLMWLLREEGLVDPDLIVEHLRQLYGKGAYWPIRDMQQLFLEADLLKARDEQTE